MSATVIHTSALLVVAAGTSVALGFTVTAGNSLVIYTQHDQVLNGITGVTDNAGTGNVYTEDYTGTTTAGQGRRAYRCQSVAGTPTTITVASSTAGTVIVVAAELAGLGTSPVGTQYPLYESTAATGHSIAYTTATSNEFLLVGISSDSDLGTITPTSGQTVVTSSRNARDAFWMADTGAAGSKTLSYTSTGFVKSDHLILTYKSAVSDPTVTSVTNTGTVEGGGIVYTVTLSAATNRTTNYAAILGGGATTATATADYDAALANAVYSPNTISYSGGNMVVPSGVTTFTFTVSTVDDALDEADEYLVATVGGVSSTATITDNDAPPVVTFTDGVESFGVVTCVATLGAVSGKDVTFDVSTANGSKTAGTHYTAIVAQTVTIPAGSLTAAITVNTL